MRAFAWMSPETFDRNREEIRAAVLALIGNPKSRRRFRLAALYEKSSGELLAELFTTVHGPVVCYRGLGERGAARHISASDSSRYDGGRPGQLVVQVVTQRGSTGRQVVPLSGEDQELHIGSRAAQYVVMGKDFERWMSPEDRLGFGFASGVEGVVFGQ
jgi:hypothetical protein